MLTGLYRAPAFYRRVEQALAAAPAAPFEIIVLDIEYYTLVCDVFGKRAGALLLQALGLHLIGMPDAHCGLMARSADDIFFFYMPAEVHFVQKLSASVSDFLDSYPLPIRMHALLGVYAANSADIPPAQMCDRARLALNIRGTVREDRIGYYDHALQEHLLREHKLLDDIPDSLLNGDFRMYLQPKVDMLTGEVIGAEALVRWLHPELGFIPPDEFIPLLERDLSVYPVDCYIWEEACRFQAQRRAAGLAPLPVSINVSRCDLYQPDLPQVLDGLLKKYDLTPRDLHLEVIERAYTEDSDRIFPVLSALRASGFCIEIDDFGTGASSLSMVADLPVDVLKLDRSFLSGFPDCPRHVETVRCMVRLAKALGLTLIIEGVETAAQAEKLCALGCQYAQGYYYSRPRPAE